MAKDHSDKLLFKIKQRLERKNNAFLKSYFKDNLIIEELLISRPSKLLTISKNITEHFKLVPIYRVNQAANRVFNYAVFVKREAGNYTADNFLDALNVKTCLYCNLHNISIKKNKLSGLVTAKPALDHFFPQNHNPFLALSFFNLIPACTFCNTNYKGGTQVTLKQFSNPYLEGFGNDCIFEIDNLVDIDEILGKKKPNFGIVFNNKTNNIRFSANISLFHLEDQYNDCADSARQAILVARNVTKKELQNKLAITHGQVDDCYHALFSTHYELRDLHLQANSKLKRDLVREHGNKDLKRLLGIKEKEND